MAAHSEANIAILDDYAGVARKHFSRIKGLTIADYPETLDPKTEEGLSALVRRLHPYQIISTMRERTPFPEALLKQLPNLKLLLTTAMRNASLDLACASERGVVVAGTMHRLDDPSVLEGTAPPPPPDHDSTTQHTWALLLSLCSRIALDDHAVKADPKAWQSGFMFALGGRTLGLAGLGRLGSNVARMAHGAFGMKVVAWSENLTQERADAVAEAAGLPRGAYRVVDKETLFRDADVLSLHLVLSERTRGVVGSAQLALMKKTALLVNTSRGPLVDEQALWAALEIGAIGGAALDVYWQEPLPPDSPWRTTEWGRGGSSQVVLSPHMGYVNEGTMHQWYAEQAENVGRWMKGEEVTGVMNV